MSETQLIKAEPYAVSLSDMKQMASAIALSGLFGLKTPEQALALMLVAQAEGLHPAVAARDYDIIQGRPSKKSEAMLRSYLSAGGSVEWHALDDTIADATFTPPKGGPLRISWNMERAKKAGLYDKKDSMFQKYPRRMLSARCISEGIRTTWPLATGGLLAPEEFDDTPAAPIDVTPKSPLDAAVAKAADDKVSGFRQRISDAENEVVLTVVGQDIAGASLSGDVQAELKELYRTRLEALRVPTPTPASVASDLPPDVL